MIVGCVGVYGERVDQALEGIRRLRPGTDRLVVIVDESVTDEQKKVLRDAGCEVYLHIWEDSMVRMRNQYLQKVQTDDWVVVFDPDECFNEQFVKDVKELTKKAEAQGADLLLINSHDVTIKQDGSKDESISDFFKNLIFRKREGTKYEGVGEVKEVHETLNIPGIQRAIRLPKEKYWYTHTKYWWEIWERACVLPGTLIFTDRGLLPIEEIRVGDRVFSEDGSFHDVSKVWQRDYKGPVVEVRTHYGWPVKVTSDHLVKGLEARVAFRMGADKALGRTQGVPSYNSGWVEARNLKGEICPFPRPNLPLKLVPNIKVSYTGRKYSNWYINDKRRKRRIQTDIPDFWWFCGIYIAEGDVWESNNIRLSLNKSDPFIARLRSYTRDELRRSPVEQEDGERLTFTIRHYDLAQWLLQNFGKGAYEKRIPIEFLGLPKRLLLSLAEGIMDGDGTPLRGGGRCLSTVNRSIAGFIILTYAKYGGFSTYSLIPPEKLRGFGDGHRKPVNRISIEGHTLRYIESIQHGNMAKTDAKYGWSDFKNLYVPVYRFWEEDYDGPIYDLTVEGPPSFTSPYIILHNSRNVFLAGGGNNVGERNEAWPQLRSICYDLGLDNWPKAREYFRKGNIDPRLKKWLWDNRYEGFDYHHEMMEFGRWYFEYLHPEEAEGWAPVTELREGSPPEVMRYVEETYLKVLGRHADDEGKIAYTNAILSRAIRREDLPEILRQSAEYRQKVPAPPEGESIRVQVPVNVDIKITDEFFVQALQRSKTYWEKIKPKLDIGTFLEEGLGDNWAELQKWYYSQKEVKMRDFIKKLKGLAS